jgi:hypothetical protein
VITTAVIYFTVTTTNGPINSGIGTVTIIANYSDAVLKGIPSTTADMTITNEVFVPPAAGVISFLYYCKI